MKYVRMDFLSVSMLPAPEVCCSDVPCQVDQGSQVVATDPIHIVEDITMPKRWGRDNSLSHLDAAHIIPDSVTGVML